MTEEKLKVEVLLFLHEMVSKGHLPNGIRKGLTEDVMAFVSKMLSTDQAEKMANRMVAQLSHEEGAQNEKNS